MRKVRMVKYIDTNKKRLVTALAITVMLMVALSILSPWSLEKIIKSIVSTNEGLVVVGIFLITYIVLFLLSRLLLRKHQGWKRIIVILIITCGMLGGFIANGGRGFGGDNVGEMLIGVLSGLLISLAVIEGGSIIFSWVKKGFDT